MRRRTLLTRSAVAATIGLTGCLGGSSDGSTTEPEPTEPMDQMTDSPSPSPTPTPSSATGADQTVIVGPEGALRFAPASFEIAVGDTVRWRWDAGGHNVQPSSMPDGADWPGTEGGDSQTFGAGYTYSYTFEVAGTYEYYCTPHRAAGMTGTFQVG